MRIIFLYIILVGVMFACLLGVLRYGEELKAPVNISGRWLLDNGFVKEVQKSCAPVKFIQSAPAFAIEQSGKFLFLTFNDSALTKMEGRLEDDSVVFNIFLPVKKDSVNSPESEMPVKIFLKIIQDDNSPYELAGKWQTPNCTGNEIINITAEKEEQ